MSNTSEPRPDALDALDRRASGAVTALDEAVDRTPVADFSDPGSPQRRRIAPLAVAAGLIVVALISAALVFTGGDEENTLAGEGAVDHLVLPDPEAAGLRIEVAFDGTETPGGGEQFLALPVAVYGPDGVDDPWESAVVSYFLPGDSTTLGGDPVDVGGPEAYFEDSGVAGTVGWADGDEVRYLMSTRVDRDTLVQIAADAVATGGDATAPIEGRVLLYTGSIGDVFPSLLTTFGRGGAPSEDRTSGVFYGSTAGDGERGMVLATRPGSADALRASNVLATDLRDVTVRGNDATLGTFFGDQETGIRHVSWLENDRTLVRVDAIGIDTDELLSLLDGLDSIDAAAFAELVADHPIDGASTGGQDESFESTANEILATVSVDEGVITHQASLTRSPEGDLAIEAATDGPGGGSGSATSVTDVDESVSVRQELDDGRTIVAGLIGPSDGQVTVSFPNQDVFDDAITGPSTATVEGSDHVLFLVVIPAALDPDGGSAITTAPDGSVVSLPL